MGKQVSCIQCGFLGAFLKDVEEPKSLQDFAAARQIDIELSLTSREQLRSDFHMTMQNADWLPMCTRAVIPSWRNMPENEVLKLRTCRWFWEHNPSHKPQQHLTLERDDQQRRFLVRVSVGSALIGAAIGALVAWMLSMVIGTGPPA